MTHLGSVTNRHLLLSLIGLGAANAALCVLMVARENANGTRVAALRDELGDADRRHQAELGDADRRYRADVTHLRQQITEGENINRKILENIDNSINALAAAKQEQGSKLTDVQQKVAGLRQAQAGLVRDHPWLTDPKKDPPYKALADRVKALEQLGKPPQAGPPPAPPPAAKPPGG